MFATIGRGGERHGEEEVHGSGDDWGAEADGSGAERGGCGAVTGSVETHDLCVEGEVCGMTVGEAQRLRQLEDENGRLKKLVADLSLDKDMLKAVIEKNGWSS